MKRLPLAIISVVLSAIAPAASSDSIKWSGSGWYQVQTVMSGDDAEDAWLIAGPFGDKGACEAGLPASQERDPTIYFVYGCELLDAEPDWD